MRTGGGCTRSQSRGCFMGRERSILSVVVLAVVAGLLLSVVWVF